MSCWELLKCTASSQDFILKHARRLVTEVNFKFSGSEATYCQ